MEKSISDLLSDAFSDSSVPSFAEDEDFENLDFKVDGVVLSQDNNTADPEDFCPLLEIASASIYQSDQEILDAEYNSEDKNSNSEEENEAEINEKLENLIDQTHARKDNEEFHTVGRNQSQNVLDIAPNVETLSTYPCDDAQGTFSTEEVKVRVRLEDCTSSEEDSGEDEGQIEEKPGDVLGTDDEHVDATGQDSHQEEGEGYFGTIQGHEGNLMIQDESSEGELQTESTKTTFFQVEYTLEYPEISYDGTEEFIEELEMENFSEEEHQEAGESFADYPSDFSSCEYVDDTRNAQPSNFESALDRTSDDDAEHESAERAATGDTFLNTEDCFDESSELFGKELDKYTSLSEKRDNSTFESWSNTEEDAKGKNQTDLNVTWERQSENTERNIPTVSRDETCLATVSSSRGSLDDSFFFNDEAEEYDVTEEEEMEEDEEEERRKEQARIQAFYRFYDEEDGDSKEERQTKVQFCMETLSQIIHYDTDSSRELSNSSDEEKEEEEEEELEEEEEEEEGEQEDKKEEEQDEEKEREEEDEGKEREEEEEEEGTDQTDNVETCPSASSDEAVLSSSQELLEVEDLTLINSPQEIPDKMTESTNKPICKRNHRCISVLKLMLSLFLVVAMGLIMFWWVSEAEEWPNFVL